LSKDQANEFCRGAGRLSLNHDVFCPAGLTCSA